MRSHPLDLPSEVEDTPTGEDEATDDDDNLGNPEVRDQVETPYLKPIRIPPMARAPPSPSLSISTTTSEFELEHGAELLGVKRIRVKEEDSGDPFNGAEVISSDESEKPARKKKKTQTTRKKTAGGKAKKPGTRTCPDEMST